MPTASDGYAPACTEALARALLAMEADARRDGFEATVLWPR
jgi:hypothetical protein